METIVAVEDRWSSVYMLRRSRLSSALNICLDALCLPMRPSFAYSVHRRVHSENSFCPELQSALRAFFTSNQMHFHLSLSITETHQLSRRGLQRTLISDNYVNRKLAFAKFTENVRDSKIKTGAKLNCPFSLIQIILRVIQRKITARILIQIDFFGD